MPGIFLNNQGKLVPLTEAHYENEAVLQELICQHPETLSGDQGGALLLVRREAAVYDEHDVNAHGSLDHLFLDADGVPVLVEVKRSTDTRIRREVVGQMLDYATGATNWKVEQLQDWLTTRCTTDRLDRIEVNRTGPKTRGDSIIASKKPGPIHAVDAHVLEQERGRLPHRPDRWRASAFA